MNVRRGKMPKDPFKKRGNLLCLDNDACVAVGVCVLDALASGATQVLVERGSGKTLVITDDSEMEKE